MKRSVKSSLQKKVSALGVMFLHSDLPLKPIPAITIIITDILILLLSSLLLLLLLIIIIIIVIIRC